MSFEQDCSSSGVCLVTIAGCCAETISLVKMSVHSLDGYHINPNQTASDKGMTFFRSHLSTRVGRCIVIRSHTVISNPVADYSLFGPGQVT